MMSIYDKLIDSLSGYAVPYEDHPQLSTRDFEYADSARSYIGFRTIQDYMGTDATGNAGK